MKWLRRIAILLVFVAICLYINKNYVIGMLFDNYIHTTLIDDLDSNKYDIEVVKFNKNSGSMIPYFYYERYSEDEYSYHYLKDVEYDIYVNNQQVYLQTIKNRDTSLEKTTIVSTPLTDLIEDMIKDLDIDEYSLIGEALKDSTYTQNSYQNGSYSISAKSTEAIISSIKYQLKHNKIILTGTTQVCFNSDSSKELINIFFDDSLNDRVYKYEAMTSSTEITEQEMSDLIKGITENGN